MYKNRYVKVFHTHIFFFDFIFCFRWFSGRKHEYKKKKLLFVQKYGLFAPNIMWVDELFHIQMFSRRNIDMLRGNYKFEFQNIIEKHKSYCGRANLAIDC